MHQIRFAPGLRPDPTGGAHDAPLGPLVGWGGEYPSPYPFPSTPSASRFRRLRQSAPVGLPQLIFRSRVPGNMILK